MKKYFVDLSEVTTKEMLHDVLSASLELPEYYGRNLDALYDILTEMCDCSIVISGVENINCLGDYAAAFLETLEDAAYESNGIEIEYE